MTTSGTKEYAEKNANCMIGCSNNCIYCYAKKFAERFKRIERETQWKNMVPNEKIFKDGECIKKFRKSNKTIMFPSSHDLPIEQFEYWLPYMENLVNSGSRILVVTKADLNSVDMMIDRFGESEFKNNLEFRITITTMDEEVRRYWEPCAPHISDRIESLKSLYHNGFKTSVSIEPMLDNNPDAIIEAVRDFCTGDIWIGKMNDSWRVPTTTDEEKFYYSKLPDRTQLHEIIHRINQTYTENIRWKDSMTPYLGRVRRNPPVKQIKYKTLEGFF